jgi:alpha-amylase
MKTVCLFFQIHQPFRHRRYRFLISETTIIITTTIPTNRLCAKLRKKLPANQQITIKTSYTKLKDKFKVSFSISGLALEQFELYAPEVIESFQNWQKPVVSNFCRKRIPIPWHR